MELLILFILFVFGYLSQLTIKKDKLRYVAFGIFLALNVVCSFAAGLI